MFRDAMLKLLRAETLLYSKLISDQNNRLHGLRFAPILLEFD
jgi:hypothetical protein